MRLGSPVTVEYRSRLSGFVLRCDLAETARACSGDTLHRAPRLTIRVCMTLPSAPCRAEGAVIMATFNTNLTCTSAKRGC
jgi:hypothetical protein